MEGVGGVGWPGSGGATGSGGGQKGREVNGGNGDDGGGGGGDGVGGCEEGGVRENSGPAEITADALNQEHQEAEASIVQVRGVWWICV